MLSITRMLPQHRAQQAEKKYTSVVQRDCRNMCVGIVGAGGIGADLAKMAKAVGMRTCGWRRAAKPQENFDTMLSGQEGLEQLLGSSDFVVCSVPLTPATRGLLGKKEFGLMKPTAWLINISRGAVVDEPELIAALQADGQAPEGAVLDVFAKEPLSPDSELWDLPNVVITPHDSWRTDEALKDNHRYFLDNAARIARGETPIGIVADELMAPAPA